MRKTAVLLLSLLTAAACASSGASKLKIPEPGIGIDQVVGPAELGYPYGPMEVRFNLGIQNNATIPLTLIRVSVSSTDPAGGAYSLRNDFYTFKETIPPHSTRVVTFWAKAFGWGRGMRESEPVTLHGTAYFETPTGAFQKVFIREVSQYSD
ncbi:MAG TPA: hypothetical protein VKH35_09775 [Thermoanaerobaculia bacterium]|jgi:hypothetical protein|nr:hypothetical protein [Thermoanaerobaculia bacterium]